ncbi:MAG: S8 family serine peptidase [Bdellovibrionaceae bacterium]|nr:S8 family serine peptidase [Bdellovibrio sp.]
MNKKLLLILIAAVQAGCAPDQTSSSNLTAQACTVPLRQVEGNTKTLSQNNSNDKISISSISQFKNFIVKFKDHTAKGITPSGQTVKEYKVKGLTLKVVANNSYTFSMNSTPNDTAAKLHELVQDNTVEYVEPDYPIYSTENDSLNDETALIETADAPVSDRDRVSVQTMTDQWSLGKVDVQDAWNMTTGSKDIVVAVLDSGIDYTHKDLKNNMWNNPNEVINGRDDDGNGLVDDIYGWNFNGNNSNPIGKSTSNHGTHVAGIVGGSGKNIFGIAPNVKLMALKFIGEDGSGATSDAIRGIDYAVKKKVFAINNSWGSNSNSKALSDAITRAENAGVLFVVAAGNGSKGVGYSIDSRGWYPASYTNSNILTVAATGSKDLLTGFSNFGRRMVDVAAPGLSILSTVSGQGYQRLSGTSMAAPLVTGLSVLVKAANPALNYKQIITLIRNSVDRVSTLTNSIASGGRVNAFKSVRAALNAGPNPSGAVGFNCTEEQ